MPTVRYTSDGGCYRDNEGNRADPDDPLLEVDDDKAAVLVEQFRFEYVDEKKSLSEAGIELADPDEPTDAEEEQADTCEVVKSDGEVCGRDLPCQYHPDGED